jgi:hypothetical protein
VTRALPIVTPVSGAPNVTVPYAPPPVGLETARMFSSRSRCVQNTSAPLVQLPAGTQLLP